MQLKVTYHMLHNIHTSVHTHTHLEQQYEAFLINSYQESRVLNFYNLLPCCCVFVVNNSQYVVHSIRAFTSVYTSY